MADYLSIRLVHKEKFLHIKISDRIKIDGASRDGMMSVDMKALLASLKIEKPFETIMMADLGSFDALVSTFNATFGEDPLQQVVYYYLVEAGDESVEMIELTEIKSEFVQVALPPYLPEPFKTGVEELGAVRDYVGYGGPDLLRFIKHYERFCKDFRKGNVPRDLTDEDERGDLERLLDSDPDEKKALDETFSNSLKEIKQRMRDGFKDYLILGVGG